MTSKNNRLAGLAKEFDALLAASSSTLVVHEFTSTAGQTVFTGADNNGVVLNYLPGSVLVALNGFMLQKTSDYTATNGTSITLTSSSSGDELLQVFAFGTFTVANHYTKAEADATNASQNTNITANTNAIAAVDTRLVAVESAEQKVYASWQIGAGHFNPAAGVNIHFSDNLASKGITYDGAGTREFNIPVSGTYHILFTCIANAVNTSVDLKTRPSAGGTLTTRNLSFGVVAQGTMINSMTMSLPAGAKVGFAVTNGAVYNPSPGVAYNHLHIERIDN